MDKNLLKEFTPEEKKGKDRIELSIDWNLKIELKKTGINVSRLVNDFLRYWLKKQEGKRDNNKVGKEEKNE